MGQMGYGYGSECHLLRWMGRHREEFNRRVLGELGTGGRLEWLDTDFDDRRMWPDAEIKGLDFLAEGGEPAGRSASALADWRRRFWPQGRGIHNWDAVGKLWLSDVEFDWLLVEAKANVEELGTDCRAEKDGAGWKKIVHALDETKQHLSIPARSDWMNGYYQYANRLAALYFLQVLHRVPTRLLLVYVTGDRSGAGRTCPQDESGWETPLSVQDGHLGLPGNGKLAGRVHKLFLPVVAASGAGSSTSRSCRS